jgi:ABC-2 type transport system ATP-binding protein
VRRDFLEGVIELIQTEGRTVFFSSHIVHEVERVADWVGIIDAGKLIHCSTMEDLKASVKRIVLSFENVPTPVKSFPGILNCEVSGRNLEITVQDFGENSMDVAKTMGAKDIQIEDLSLEDIFVAMVGGSES